MANVTANVAVDLIGLTKSLPMFDVKCSKSTAAKMLRLDSRGNRQIYAGNFFYDQSGRPAYASSRFTGFTQYAGSQVAYTVNAFDLAGRDYEEFAKRQDFDGLKRKVFAGDDVITGSKLNDRLCGWGGSNKLVALDGNDVLRTYVRADASDSLYGGAGADVHQIVLSDQAPGDGRYTGIVHVYGFDPKQGDKLQFVFQNEAVGSIPMSFDAEFTGERGSIVYDRMDWYVRHYDGYSSYLNVDANGDKLADAKVRLVNYSGELAVRDLILGETV